MTEVTTDITDWTGCHGVGHTWLSSVCAHAFSRLRPTATVATATATGPELNGKYNYLGHTLGLFVDPITVTGSVPIRRNPNPKP